MKRINTLTLLILFAALVFYSRPTVLLAQTVITSANMPSEGELHISKLADTTQVSGGAAGSNQVWDFSGLNITQAIYVESFKDPANLAFADSFPGSTVCGREPRPRYTYYASDPSKLWIVGERDTLNIIPYDNKQLYMTYPFAYNDMLADTFTAQFKAFGYPVYRTGIWKLKADGYGTLKLPSGNFSDVLRVTGENTITDVSLLNVTTRYKIQSWYGATEKFPLLSIVSIVRTPAGLSPTYEKYVKVNSSVVGIGEENPFINDISLYPNPADSRTKVKLTLSKPANTEFRLTDLSGKTIFLWETGNLSQGTHICEIETQGITPGFYLLEIKGGGHSRFSKIAIKH
jgi:hypothetical protein